MVWSTAGIFLLLVAYALGDYSIFFLSLSLIHSSVHSFECDLDLEIKNCASAGVLLRPRLSFIRSIVVEINEHFRATLDIHLYTPRSSSQMKLINEYCCTSNGEEERERQRERFESNLSSPSWLSYVVGRLADGSCRNLFLTFTTIALTYRHGHRLERLLDTFVKRHTANLTSTSTTCKQLNGTEFAKHSHSFKSRCSAAECNPPNENFEIHCCSPPVNHSIPQFVFVLFSLNELHSTKQK